VSIELGLKPEGDFFLNVEKKNTKVYLRKHTVLSIIEKGCQLFELKIRTKVENR